jgi:hypothetical protein
MVSTPKPESAASQAQAQSNLNRDTALTQQQINQTNQITPYGNLTYNQTGSSSFVDSNGRTVTTPTYTATTTLSPAQQAILDKTNQASLNLAGLAANQSAAINNQLSKPFEFTNNDASNWAYDLGSQRILPQQAKNADALRSQLIASGIRPGTAAWNAEQERLTNANTDQLNQLALTGRNQAFQEALTQYNNPVNTISALMSGSQVQNPNFVNTPTTNVGGVDYIGASNANYQAQNQASQAKMGGLFGLLSGGIGLLSDIRAKTDIQVVGTLDNGLSVYLYRYIGSPEYHIGLMAQEVEEIRPEAVTTGADGLKRVRYEIATEAA